MDTTNVVHIQNGMLLSSKKNKIMRFAGKWIELGNTILNEVVWSQKDKHIMFLLICVAQLLILMNFRYLSLTIVMKE